LSEVIVTWDPILPVTQPPFFLVNRPYSIPCTRHWHQALD